MAQMSDMGATQMPVRGVRRLAWRFALLSFATGFVVTIEPAPTDVFFAVSLGLLMLGIGLRFEMTRETRGIHALMLVFLAFNVLSLVTANSLSFGLKYFAITLYLALIPLVMTHFVVTMGRGALDGLYTAFLTGVTLGGVVGLGAVTGLAPGPTEMYYRSADGLRLAAFFKDPNVYGPYMATGGFLLLAMALMPSSRHKAVALGLAFFAISMMVLTFSRGAWVNSAAALLTFVALMLAYTRTLHEMRGLLILMGFSALALMIGLPFVLSLMDLGDFFQDRAQLQYYDTERFSNWIVAWNVAIREPLGIGPGHFVRQGVFAQSEFELDPHNILLKVLVENGWLGAVAFFGSIGLVMSGLWRTFRWQDARRPLRLMLFAILTGQLVNSIVVDSLHWRHLFIMIGFACAELVLAHAERRRRQPAPVRPLRQLTV